MSEAEGDPRIIDIRRAGDVTLACPRCRMERVLPVNWQEILRATADPEWDGILRCVNGHEPAAMIVPLPRLPGEGEGVQGE
jgi:hypothetical protein